LPDDDHISALGEIAAGMARRFVELGSVISRELDMARPHFYLQGEPRVMAHLQRMQEAIGQMQVDLESLLTAGRRGIPVTEPVDLNTLVADVIRERFRSLNVAAVGASKIRYAVEVDWTLPAIQGDPLHLKLVVRNILQNAIEAMPSGGTVGVTVGTKIVRARSRSIPAGRYAVIEVADEGGGIERRLMDRIGEPFLTTKEGHAGLGIFTARAVVHQHNGRILFEWAEPTGTQVVIYLPLIR
jgi:signal transduction histidine kinase